MLSKTKIALAAALVIGTASTALARGYVLPGSTDGVNPAYHPRWFPNYPGVDNGPNGDPNAFPPCFDATGHVYYPTSNACNGYRAVSLRQSSQRANPAYHPSIRHGGGAYASAPGYSFPVQPYRSSGETPFERNWFKYQDCSGPQSC